MKRQLLSFVLFFTIALRLGSLHMVYAAEEGATRYCNAGEGIPYTYQMDVHAYAALITGDQEETMPQRLTLNAGDVVCIDNVQSLLWFSDYVNSGGATAEIIWELGADLDGLERIADFSPVGTSAHPFSGIFNGGGHRIDFTQSGDGGEAYRGMFGNLENALIQRLSVKASLSAVSGASIGGIIGQAKNSSIEHCDAEFAIAVSTSEAAVGGIVGTVKGGEIRSCTSAGSIATSANAAYTGGIAGQVTDGGQVENCANAATVHGSAYTGGIAGYVANEASIRQCENNAADVAGGSYTGGIAGVIHMGNVSQSFNTGGISGNIMAAGGIAGQLVGGGQISECFNAGEVHATSAGGIAGIVNGSTILNSYHTGSISATMAGGIAGAGSNSLITGCYSAFRPLSIGTFVPIAPNTVTMQRCFYDDAFFTLGSFMGRVTTSELASGQALQLDQEIWSFMPDRFPQLQCMLEYDAAAAAVRPRTPYIHTESKLLYTGAHASGGTAHDSADIHYWLPDEGFTLRSCSFEEKRDNVWALVAAAVMPGSYRATLNYIADDTPEISRKQSCTFEISAPTTLSITEDGSFQPQRSGIYFLPENLGGCWHVGGDDTSYAEGAPLYLTKGRKYRFISADESKENS